MHHPLLNPGLHRPCLLLLLVACMHQLLLSEHTLSSWLQSSVYELPADVWLELRLPYVRFPLSIAVYALFVMKMAKKGSYLPLCYGIRYGSLCQSRESNECDPSPPISRPSLCRKYKVEKWSDRNCSKSEETDSLRENAG